MCILLTFYLSISESTINANNPAIHRKQCALLDYKPDVQIYYVFQNISLRKVKRDECLHIGLATEIHLRICQCE